MHIGAARHHLLVGHEVDFLFAATVRGVFLTATEGAKRLDASGSREKQNGRIVLIGSITAEKVFPATAVYGATKAAVRHLGKALRRVNGPGGEAASTSSSRDISNPK